MDGAERTRRRQATALARLEGLVSERDGPRRSVPRALAAVGVFVAVLWGALRGLSAGIERTPEVRLDEGSYQRSKVIYFDAHKDEFDLVFVGSSQVWRQVSPQAFDEELARAGLRSTSFNFGLPGMTFPETVHTALWILERRPARLRWLVLELRPVLPHMHPENDLSRRQIQWHTPAVLGLLARANLASERGPVEGLAALLVHLRHFLHREANVALGLPWLARALGRTDDVDPAAVRADGCEPIELEARTDRELQERRREFLAEVGELPERVREVRAEEHRAARPYELAALSWLVARLRARGVEPIFMISAPSWDAQGEFEDAARRGVLPTLLAYDDPVRFPEFYAAESLFDFGHLGTRGALLYTRRLARDVAEVLRRAAR